MGEKSRTERLAIRGFLFLAAAGEATQKERFGDPFDFILKKMPTFTPFTFTAQCTGGLRSGSARLIRKLGDPIF